MAEQKDGGPAFPTTLWEERDGVQHGTPAPGMTLRDYFAGQALSNPELCSGRANEYDLIAWFGKNAMGITAFQIATAQAYQHADEMLRARSSNVK